MSGWNSLKIKITHYYVQLYMRFFGNQDVINFHHNFLSAKKILIVMPLEIEQFEIASSILPRFQKIFENVDIRYLLSDRYTGFFSIENPDKFIEFNDKDKNMFFLPSHRLIDLISKEEYEIIISLVYKFDLFTSYLCLRSKAPIRVSLYDDLSAPYFTFQIKDQTTSFLGERYKNLAKYISMMRQPENSEN